MSYIDCHFSGVIKGRKRGREEEEAGGRGGGKLSVSALAKRLFLAHSTRLPITFPPPPPPTSVLVLGGTSQSDCGVEVTELSTNKQHTLFAFGE